MGTLRFLLALAVLFYHMNMVGFSVFKLPFADFTIRPMDGKPAVEAFFILSGFAMAGALATRYRDSAIGRFYMSRVLRLYPAYLLILAVEIIVAAWLWGPKLPQPASLWSAYGGQPLADRLAWVTGNLLIVGKELWARTDFYALQFVNPAWSLSIELQFYLLVPFVMRWRTSGLVALFAAAAASRVLVFAIMGQVTAIYFTLPWHLCLFLLGVLSYRLLGHWQRVPLRVALGPAIAMMLLTMLYPHYTESATRADWIKIGYWIALFFTLPLLARVSKRGRLDDFLGDLSYPVYLANLGVIYTVLSLAPLRGAGAPMADIVVIGGTIGLAVVVVVAVDRPMTLIRRELAARRRQMLAPVGLPT